MLRRLHITVLFLMIAVSVNAQFQWQAINGITNTDNQRFDDVFFLDENVGWEDNP